MPLEPLVYLCFVGIVASVLLVRRRPKPEVKPYSDPPKAEPVFVAQIARKTGEHYIHRATVSETLPPPPENGVMVSQLEIGQKVFIRTVNSHYILTLRTCENRAFDVVRIRKDKDGRKTIENFGMLLTGTHLPKVGTYADMFIPGGYLIFKKVDKHVMYHESPSSEIAAVMTEVAIIERKPQAA